jgi:ribonucleoside-diphosphate reductase alpha chain
MNKNLSLAIEEAVRKFPSKQKIKDRDIDKRADLFSLTQETELFQNDRGITVKIDRSKDSNLTNFGKATLSDRYLGFNESFQDLFARVASTYADDNLHGQRIYDYISNLWFMPATPILSNGGTKRGLPISCFLNEASDSLGGILDLWSENVWLAAKGGGIGSYWGNLRSIGEKIGKVGKTSGIIPFIKVMDSLTMAISQGSLRRGSAACYLPIEHPEIEEFIEMRRPTGGDPNRKSLN